MNATDDTSQTPGEMYLNLFLIGSAVVIGLYISSLYGGKSKKRSRSSRY